MMVIDMAAPKENGKGPGGRPHGAKGIKKSKLRKVETKLLLLKDKALDNIEISVNGGTVDKEVLLNSRWVVQQLVTVSKASIQEEAIYNDLRSSVNIQEDEKEEEEEVKPRFSLVQLPKKSDLE